MTCIRAIAIALLAVSALLTGGEASAQARMPPQPWQDPAGPPAPMDVWLKRLVGRFRYEGMVEVVYEQEGYAEHRCGSLPPDPNQASNPPPPAVPYCSGIKGMSDCIAIGAGPGVQCVLNVTWQDINEVTPEGAYNLPGGVSNLAPAMLLFGIDPGKPALNYLQVDNKGLPEGGPGFIAGDRATFKTSCVNAPTLFLAMKPAPPGRIEGPPRTCERILRLDAKPDSRVVHMAMDIAINNEMWTRYEITLRRVPQTDPAVAPAKPAAKPSKKASKKPAASR